MLPFPGNKHDVLKAYTAGEILPSGRDSLVTHRALNLQHWLGADALYGIVYNQVTALCHSLWLLFPGFLLFGPRAPIYSDTSLPDQM